MTKQQILKIVFKFCVELNNPTAFKKLESYVQLVEMYNLRFNLTSFTGKTLWDKGVWQSLKMMALLNKRFDLKNETLLDVGTGAGFPSLPFLIVYPFFKVVVHEPHKKKADFLKVVAKSLKLPMKVLVTRTEKAETPPFYNVIVARAVGSVRVMAEITSKVITNNGSVFLLKGSQAQHELRVATKILYTLHYTPTVLHHNDLNLSPTLCLVELCKNGVTPCGYPRPWPQILRARRLSKR